MTAEGCWKNANFGRELNPGRPQVSQKYKNMQKKVVAAARFELMTIPFSFKSLAQNDFFQFILSFLAIYKHPVAIKVGQSKVGYRFVVEQCASLFRQTCLSDVRQ